MPKRTDIRNILIIGSGPIVIGQGCEFDYSGTQACKALREEGYSVVLLNSNPATIMTDPGLADRTYIEPITPEFIEKVLVKEREDGRPVHALLPTLGGQTGLNCAMECHERGILQRHGVEMIGASAAAIHKAEDRTAFKNEMIRIGLQVPKSGIAHTWAEALAVLEQVKLPCCIRPAYTLGGSGGGFCRTPAEFETVARRGLAYSRVSEILIEEDLYGWKEFELEVMRDRADNVVIICSIENVDPMGVHTGDSITVAPIQTLTDKEYQKMRDGAIAIIRAIGVDTGGCNIQFAVNPRTGRQVVIEMNPRVSRSSALASKATGYPIARIAAKLAMGYTLDELPNDITGTTPASFEPTIDYVVVKMPRWSFEKFPDCDETLTTQMKSVGEAMAIGRTFKEAFQKCIRSMEIKRYGFGLDGNDVWLQSRRHEGTKARRHEGAGSLGGSPLRGEPVGQGSRVWDQGLTDRRAADVAQPQLNVPVPPPGTLGGSTAAEAPPDTEEEHARGWPIPEIVLYDKLATPCQGRPYYIRYAFKMGWTVERVHELTRIDPWFLEQMRELVEFETDVLVNGPADAAGSAEAARTGLRSAKSLGYSEVQLAHGRRLNGANSDGVTTRLALAPPLAVAARPVAADAAGVVASAGGCEGSPTGRASGEDWPPIAHAHAPSPSASPSPLPLPLSLGGRGDAAEPVLAPVYKLVDTCAAEFEARTPYYYSSHESLALDAGGGEYVDDEIRVSDRPKIVVLGGGPNRIGQGIEFDYCCCHASFAARKAGYESVMINSNPETVSTDFDTSDMLFFEPLTKEDVLNVIQRLNGDQHENSECRIANNELGAELPSDQFVTRNSQLAIRVRGVIVQFGGQTPLNLARSLKDAGVPIIGTQPEMIHAAEDRDEFQKVLRELSLLQPPNGVARGREVARQVAARLGYPILVRPSYVLGGRGMRVCNNVGDLDAYMDAALSATDRADSEEDNPILIDKFLIDAIEVDVDAVADYGGVTASGRDHGRPRMCMVAGIMEHIEEAGVHSGDSTCVLPPFSLGRTVIEELFRSTQRLAKRLEVCGAMNVQYAILNRTVYVLEVNPRAARTLPFVAKATGVPWADVATRVMLGEALGDVLAEHGVKETPWPRHTSVKAPVFPFEKFPGVDVVLGPEMRSTGEVMAIGTSFGRAFAKAQIATGLTLPLAGNVLVSVNDPDKPRIVSVARDLYDLGFKIFSTVGTRKVLSEAGIPAVLVSKAKDGVGPFLLELIENGTLNLLINTPIHSGPASDEGRWRAAATARRVPLITTLAGAKAAAAAIRAMSNSETGEPAAPLTVKPLQSYFA